MQEVVQADLRVASSIGGPFKFYYWRLTLACGHVVERRVRYLPETEGRARRGFAAMHHPPNRDRVPEPQKRARCDACRRS